MKEIISKRFQNLIDEGKQLIQKIPPHEYGGGNLAYYAASRDRDQFQAWISSVSNLIDIVVPSKSNYREELERLLTHRDMSIGVPSLVVQRLYGLLLSAQKEWESGLLKKIIFIIAAETFDDFLDKAAEYHKSNKSIEASILASAVLEDSMKKIAIKNNVPLSGQSLELLIDELVKAEVLTSIKAKRLKAAAGIRNHALHAEWEKFDIKDTGALIQTVRDLIAGEL
jgi:uncharacterized protein YutE (UPF0331/DUF86 family)